MTNSKEALNKFKYEVANEVGVNLKQGYNGDLSSRDAGRVGGNMVKKLIETAEKQMANKQLLNKFLDRIPDGFNPVAAEMEAFALFYNAKLLNKKAEWTNIHSALFFF